MTAYIIRRLFYMIPVVLGVTMIVFLLFNVVGGDPTSMLVGKNPKPREVRDVQRKYDLDKPVFLNFHYLSSQEETVKAAVARAAGRDDEAGREAEMKPVFRAGKAAVPALAAVMESGADAEKAVASSALSELAGFGGDDAAFPGWWAANRGDFELSAIGRLSKILSSQYFIFLGDLLRLDFGRSFKNKQKISDMVLEGIVPSLSLSVPAFLFGVVAAIYISILCAFYRNTWIDRSIVIASVLGMSLSSLVYIIACQYFLAYQLSWFPVWGYERGLPAVTYLMLPAIIWVLVALGSDVRFFRTVILDEINQDYVRTARAKGVSENMVLFKHVLKNAMIPIITRLVIAIPFLYTGSLLLERFFGIPGLGNMLVEAVNNSDLFVVRAMTFIGAILYVGGNLLTDVCYALVDPRIRLG